MHDLYRMCTVSASEGSNTRYLCNDLVELSLRVDDLEAGPLGPEVPVGDNFGGDGFA